MFFIEYDVLDAGWAKGRIGDLEKSIDFVVSYLHDSLKELAESAINIQTKDYAKVVFMDEPGEFILELTRKDNLIIYQLKWYPDWYSWNMINTDNYQIQLEGKTTVAKYINQVREVLIKILNKMNPEAYKEKWVLHEFPTNEYNLLK
ncbi:hypothetical protein [uncultured Lacinutrix sp.]|uniref:hypothetical protein n=1 Tax=uncultured Lacinutrix sp. TaxID=574032 RepID=UPI0026309D70|nr:hypothetical protein [uncultured Lacinutrix sp.]